MSCFYGFHPSIIIRYSYSLFIHSFIHSFHFIHYIIPSRLRCVRPPLALPLPLCLPSPFALLCPALPFFRARRRFSHAFLPPSTADRLQLVAPAFPHHPSPPQPPPSRAAAVARCPRSCRGVPQRAHRRRRLTAFPVPSPAVCTQTHTLATRARLTVQWGAGGVFSAFVVCSCRHLCVIFI